MLDGRGKQEERIDLLVETQERIATALEGICLALTKGLGEGRLPGYPEHDCVSGLIAEKEMAALLDRKAPTLAGYRRAGKFPGCWIRNGRTILWKKDATLATWRDGLP